MVNGGSTMSELYLNEYLYGKWYNIIWERFLIEFFMARDDNHMRKGHGLHVVKRKAS